MQNAAECVQIVKKAPEIGETVDRQIDKTDRQLYLKRVGEVISKTRVTGNTQLPGPHKGGLYVWWGVILLIRKYGREIYIWP